ncbi:uncharacterized protein LOC115629590 [Scaptodrosophila lebanonensis]|uniref:Uncharacterized protein LOC115629590 n=1 Tax=Drosophila lebanonensis TaxID=7225 RepID=A0A6J2TZN0_DROLE|nr:uncharacterized protein LOC115629590 [Scaptodrosophila lebanonensis]
MSACSLLSSTGFSDGSDMENSSNRSELNTKSNSRSRRIREIAGDTTDEELAEGPTETVSSEESKELVWKELRGGIMTKIKGLGKMLRSASGCIKKKPQPTCASLGKPKHGCVKSKKAPPNRRKKLTPPKRRRAVKKSCRPTKPNKAPKCKPITKTAKKKAQKRKPICRAKKAPKAKPRCD